VRNIIGLSRTGIICEISSPKKSLDRLSMLMKDRDHLSYIELGDFRAGRAEKVQSTSGCHFWQNWMHKAFGLRIIRTYY
jgi:hypothetical protein